MTQKQEQANIELEKKVADFIKHYIAGDTWKAEDARVKDAFKELQNENSEFSKEFGNQFDIYGKELEFTNIFKFAPELEKLVLGGASLKLYIGRENLFVILFNLGLTMLSLDSVNNTLKQKQNEKSKHLVDEESNEEGEEQFVNNGLEFKDNLKNALDVTFKRKDLKEALMMISNFPALIKLSYMSALTESEAAKDLVVKTIMIMSDNGKDLLKTMDAKNLDKYEGLKNPSLLDLMCANDMLPDIMAPFYQCLTEEQLKSFLDKKLDYKDESHEDHGFTKLGFLVKRFAVQKVFNQPTQIDQFKEKKLASNILLLLSLGADTNIKLPGDKTVFDIMGKNRKQLDDLIELSQKIKSLSEQLAKSAVDGKHIYTTNSDDLYRFKRNITLMLVAGNVTQDPAFGKLIKDIVQNPGNDKNKELLEGLYKDIMKRSKDIIQGMSNNPFYRILQNIYNFCNAIYSGNFSIFIKGSVVLDTTKFNPDEKAQKSFAEKIEKELAERNKAESPSQGK